MTKSVCCKMVDSYARDDSVRAYWWEVLNECGSSLSLYNYHFKLSDLEQISEKIKQVHFITPDSSRNFVSVMTVS
jgi:hypothetical protein